MKRCPYCAEEIQDDALKCRYCGEFLAKLPEEKWYFRTSVFVIAFLCIGPIALPLVWINPRLNRTKKIIISLIIVILSYYMWILFMKSLKSLEDYYKFLQQLY